jgi:hypothetical protein
MYRPPPVGVIGTRISGMGERAHCSGHRHRRFNASESQPCRISCLFRHQSSYGKFLTWSSLEYWHFLNLSVSNLSVLNQFVVGDGETMTLGGDEFVVHQHPAARQEGPPISWGACRRCFARYLLTVTSLLSMIEILTLPPLTGGVGLFAAPRTASRRVARPRR